MWVGRTRDTLSAVLLKQATLRGIRDGAVTLAFRRWRRPTVKPGGTLLTAIGQLRVEAVDVVDLSRVTETEAVAAGFTNLAALRSELLKRPDGELYRIRLSLAGPDPRLALRDEVPDRAELQTILTRLERIDSRSTTGPWTQKCLAVINAHPAELAADLAQRCGMKKAAFKVRVRKLKALGLTQSLDVGYRLLPRGQSVRSLRAKPRR